jgi:hypothetical protein
MLQILGLDYFRFKTAVSEENQKISYKNKTLEGKS